MTKKKLWLACALAAVFLVAAGVSPSMAQSWGDYASPKIDSKYFTVEAGSDTYVEVVFDWDAPCTLMAQLQGENGSVLGTFDLNTGEVVQLSGGGTFYVFVWSQEGACNWTATLADFGSVPSVTGAGGVTTGGSGDCGGAIVSKTTFTTPGLETVSIWITPDCVPAFVCFTVSPGLTCSIVDTGITSAGNNCKTGAYIDDPGLVVARGCCTDDIVYSCGRDPKGGGMLKWGTNSFGPGTYTLMPAGGRKFKANVGFSVQ